MHLRETFLSGARHAYFRAHRLKSAGVDNGLELFFTQLLLFSPSQMKQNSIFSYVKRNNNNSGGVVGSERNAVQM